jgi:hypothetical protein
LDLFTSPDLDVRPNQNRAIRALANVHGKIGDRVTGINITDLERRLRESLDQLARKGAERPFFRAPICRAEPLEEISSSAWNEAQERIYIDLYAIYRGLKESFQEDAYAGAVTREKFLQTKAAILKIINEVRLYQFLKANPECKVCRLPRIP